MLHQVMEDGRPSWTWPRHHISPNRLTPAFQTRLSDARDEQNVLVVRAMQSVENCLEQSLWGVLSAATKTKSIICIRLIISLNHFINKQNIRYTRGDEQLERRKRGRR